MECKCQSCQSACTHKPGWFKAGQVENVAEHLGVSLQELFETKLMVDYFVRDKDDVFLLSPSVINGKPGHEFGYNNSGTCVFYEGGQCTIHAVKPFECAAYDHTKSVKEAQVNHREAMQSWDNEESQQQIVDLLRRQPVTDLDPDAATAIQVMLKNLFG